MVMQIKEKIEEWVREVLGNSDISLVHPKELKNGDYSFFNHSPKTENDLVGGLMASKIPEVEKIETMGKFVNIYLQQNFFADSIGEIKKQKENFGRTNLLNGQKIMVEYTDPNPLKEFHIGHLMSNTIGEAVSRIIENNGAKIKRANWQGDVGIHIANAVWGKMQKPELRWGEAYAYGAKNFEDNKEEITEINKKLYERSDEAINQLYDEGRKDSLESFEKIYDRLGTKFDHYFFESKEGVEGKKIVEEHIQDGIFEKSDGAVVFRGEKYGLHTRVFINSNGLPTYEAKELGLNKKKFEVEPDLDKSIIVTGNEIKEYFKVLLKALSLVLPDVAEKTLHLPHGMLKLPEGKMSSRTGNVITAESLIEQVKEKVFEKIKDREFSEEEKESVAEVVAIGAIKYSILRQAIGGDIIFDLEKSISFEGDSGPYLQYTVVRANSVLEKSNLTPSPSPINMRGDKTERPEGFDVQEIEKLLYRLPEIVERAGKEYAPHHLVTYLVELAASFNSFYANEKIIDEADPAGSAYKLAITEAVYQTLKNGLHLLGIKVPERM
jgi:arginyl-tRNA synthetase